MLRRKVGGSSKSPVMTQEKQKNVAQKKLNSKVERNKEETKKIQIFSYFGRQVNLDFHSKDANVYQLLRSWVQNDPECDVSGCQDVLRSLLPPPQDAVDELPCRPPSVQEQNQDVNYINSLESVNTQSLLESHLVYMKAVRKWMSTRRNRRRLRYTKRLQALSPGFESIPVVTPGRAVPPLHREKNNSASASSSESPKKKRRRLSVDTVTSS